MTLLQRLQIRLSESRTELHRLAALDEPTDEQRTELANAVEKHEDLERRYRAAVAAAAGDDPPGDDPPAATEDREARERRELEGRCELRRYVSAAAHGRAPDGAELELQQAEGLASSEVPLAMFAPPPVVETRADVSTAAPADVGAVQRPVLGRIFANTSAMFLGVRFDRVPAGEALYPVVTAGSSPSRLAKGAAAPDVAAATIAARKLSPVRSQIAYQFRREDVGLFGRGLESALRMDMSGALAEHVDAQILTGDGSAPNVRGFVHELTAPTPATATVTFASSLSSLGGQVDGRYAAGRGDVRVLLAPATHAKISGLGAGGNAFADALAVLGEELGGIRVSALLPAPASNLQNAIIRRGSLPGEAVAAFWPGVSLIRDETTLAKTGEVRLTAVVLWSFAVIREASYNLLSFKLA